MTTGRFLPPCKGFREEERVTVGEVLLTVLGLLAAFAALELWMIL